MIFFTFLPTVCKASELPPIPAGAIIIDRDGITNGSPGDVVTYMCSNRRLLFSRCSPKGEWSQPGTYTYGIRY